jgi:hypothetical protein
MLTSGSGPWDHRGNGLGYGRHPLIQDHGVYVTSLRCVHLAVFAPTNLRTATAALGDVPSAISVPG